MDGFAGAFALCVAQIGLNAPVAARTRVADAQHRAERGEGVNRCFAAGFLNGMPFQVAGGEGGHHAFGQADAVHLPFAGQFQTFDLCGIAVHVFPSGCVIVAGLGRAGVRIVVAALFHADVGKVDEVVVIGFKAGQHDVAQAAFAGNAQFQIAGGFGFQVWVGFHGEVGMWEVKPHFIGGGRAESGAPFGHYRPVG